MELVLENVPVPRREELGLEYDDVEQEPNVDVVIRTHRTTDDKGQPCSSWQFGYVLEGEAHAAMSQRQADYTATTLRHVAWLIQDQPAVNMSGEERVAAIARRYQAQLRATMNGLAALAYHLVKEHGLHHAASILRMKEYKVAQLIKSRPQVGRVLEQEERRVLPTPRVQRDLLGEIARGVVREKVAAG